MTISSVIRFAKKRAMLLALFALTLPLSGNTQSLPPPPPPPPSPTPTPPPPAGPTGGLGISNPIAAKTFGELVQAIANAVIAIGIPLVAIFLIYAGFLFVTSGGNEQKLQQAKTTFYWALIGGVIVIGAFAIATAIVNFAKNLSVP
ncbi:MAG: hypothetical protein COU90_01540 [Candidatus Ryanbacteria bacterium CG10_big_fil_rev_8_21_14_0_10_43_42]|uniref:Uncharacterized protein n=1 Tax=Candidatus Ryanbacteria bacterium CG10_big_fil_rev_8_21_14_0_10_43_42 TaxID=1974864 RepID=A0A2M8KX53_9BACT|nr:MAG: hypothetical protein COU90_01540 [Candidatus Ryanbacteria bacterium CG10_big_fil_rev_8_21_14_0_10_43_42]